jgi:hypothetical protein
MVLYPLHIIDVIGQFQLSIPSSLQLGIIQVLLKIIQSGASPKRPVSGIQLSRSVLCSQIPSIYDLSIHSGTKYRVNRGPLFYLTKISFVTLSCHFKARMGGSSSGYCIDNWTKVLFRVITLSKYQINIIIITIIVTISNSEV